MAGIINNVMLRRIPASPWFDLPIIKLINHTSRHLVFDLSSENTEVLDCLEEEKMDEKCEDIEAAKYRAECLGQE